MKNMRTLMLLLLVVTAASRAAAQSAPPIDRAVVLEASLATSQREFRIGETIPLQLAFSSKVRNRYQVNAAQYDRSGRMNYEHFTVSPADGAVDPLPTYTSSMGGTTNFTFLKLSPWTINLNINEWIRFTRPGNYRLVISSKRVSVRDPANAFGAANVLTRSNEIELKIVPADPAWQKQVLRNAVAALDAPAPKKPSDFERYTNSRRQALETLRFLGTADSTRELAKRMRGEDNDGLDYICMLGLIASPDRDVARAALETELADPDHPIDGNFLYALRMVSYERGTINGSWQQAQQTILEELIAALPLKRAKALAISLNTAVSLAWNRNEISKETTDKLVAQLLSTFDQLPVNVQNSLLTYNWPRIGSSAMLPLLKRYAEAYTDFPEMRVSTAYESLSLSAIALRRWYELDPAGARPAIIAEITRPRPRYSAKVLGILPDKTLPEVDLALAENLARSHDHDASSNLASLIARYASDTILSQVTHELDPRIGKWGCAIQNPLLAYVLRVNPAAARPRIEQAIAARDKNVSACNTELFQQISEIYYDPTIEEIGIRSLDDPDPEVAMTAATMLGKFGSADAESALWQRYAKWTAQWEGHESEFDLMAADGMSAKAEERMYQSGLGQNLLQALAMGKSWLTDKAKLQRLAQMTRVKRLQRDLNNYLKNWDNEALPLTLDQNSADNFHATVAQYELHSIDDLKEKLTQFPAGTKFFFSLRSGESAAKDQTRADLVAFLNRHGMSEVKLAK